jgi:hypothetical protein
MNDKLTHAALDRLRHGTAIVCLLATVGLAPGTAVAGPNDVPAPFRGAWVPAKATCDSPIRMGVGADRLTLQNGKDTEEIGGVEMAGPGYFAPGYRGIMAVLLTEFSGDQPAVVTFNLGEKRGVAQLDYAPVIPGKGNAMQAKYNAHISKLALARRFPLDKVPLKKCAGAGSTG